MQKKCFNNSLENNGMSSDRRVKIDLSALAGNYASIKKIVNKKDVIAYVKADAYGHGLLKVVATLIDKGVSMFAVASLNELLEIRTLFSDIRVLVGSSYYSEDSLNLIAKHQGEIVVFSESHVELLESISLPCKLNIWLKINTGMNRMGISEHNFNSLLLRLKKCKNVNDADIILMTHFACADDSTPSSAMRQIDRFDQITKGVHLRRSAANSAAILNVPQSYYDIVRPGILLYGISPLAYSSEKFLGFKPVMTVESKVIAINDCEAGEYVGYKEAWRAKNKCKIAIVAFGYADGYPLTINENTSVLIKGHICNIVGRVSMDTLAVYLPNLANITIGDFVQLWGNDISISDIANSAGTIPYELLTRVSKRRIDFIYENKNEK
ncbi:MAG: alanine racemase [Legionellales bacterium]|jgi:alanine racemase|nr:alanine racemase [Legionellales bacterium]